MATKEHKLEAIDRLTLRGAILETKAAELRMENLRLQFAAESVRHDQLIAAQNRCVFDLRGKYGFSEHSKIDADAGTVIDPAAPDPAPTEETADPDKN